MAHHQIHDQTQFARESYRRSTQNILHYDEKSWRWSYLKYQFESNVELDSVYKCYTQKIQHGYFAMFLTLQFLLGTTHFLIVLFTNMGRHSLNAVALDLSFYAILAASSILGIYISERQMKKKSKYIIKLSAMAFCLMFCANIIIPLYHYWKNSWYFRPAFTTYLVIACYVFFNIEYIPAKPSKQLPKLISALNRAYGILVSSTGLAIILGIFTSTIHGVLLIFISYPDIETTWKGIVCEVLYLACLNAMGVYFRVMNEFVKRKSFLDHRDYVKSNIELRYCKNDEENLMLSIIPENVIDDVRKDIMNYFKCLHLNIKIEKNQYIRFHENVTILYADIVNYTAMTTKLTPPTRLVETLNDLFSTFDDASEKLKVLRIKFLGDCYYCVSGLPPDNIPGHADACVELGLEMIKIIRIESVKHNIDIDMRIGIHTGKIYSGVIGMSKWQYDVWSQDVSIANKMEMAGVAGKVHITQQTRNQLKKTYNISETDRGVTCEVIKPYNLTTFLVTPEEVPIRASMYEKHQRNTVYGNRRSTGALYTVEDRVDLTFMEGHILSNLSASGGNDLETIPSVPPSPLSQNFPPLARSSVMSISRPSQRFRRESRSHSWTMGTERTIQRRRTSTGSTAAAQDGRREGESLRQREGESLRRTAFFDNTINRFNQVRQKTDTEIMETIDNMPLSKHDQWTRVKNINSFLMIFKDLRNEWTYFRMPDPLFKYYLTAEILVLLSIFVIENLTLAESWDYNWPDILAISSIALLLLLLTPISWTSYIWNTMEKKTEREEYGVKYFNTFYDEPTEHPEIAKPNSKILRLLYEASETMARNIFIRVGIYLLICGLFFVYLLVELVNCDNSMTSKDNENSIYGIFLRIFLRADFNTDNCLVPWHLTEACILTIIMTFIFLRIHIWIKFIVSATITGAYSIILWNFSGDYFRGSATFNRNVDPAISHVLSVIFLTLTLHFIDRQQDYLNRLDHQWNHKLITEKENAQLWKRINRSLLNTILPEHVAGIFLSVNRQPRTLYCEAYPNVAVLFATIVNYDIDEITEKLFLKVMDEMIGAFDFALDQNFRGKIEKIKMSNWTYMAACGLAPGNRDSQISVTTGVDSSGSVAKTLLEFAVHLMQIVPRHMNADTQQDFKIRIGMSHGEVTAGVVGAKKPLYDIWGDTVNMASRMDSTGVPGCIQVTSETAETLRKQGIACTYRGKIYVKGKSCAPGVADVPTHFVDLQTKKWNHHDIPVLPGQGIYNYSSEHNGTSTHFANDIMNGSRESVL